jgi:predicted Zn-dependent protease
VADLISTHPILVERLNDVERLIQRVKKDGKLRSTQTIAMIVCNYLESEGKKGD